MATQLLGSQNDMATIRLIDDVRATVEVMKAMDAECADLDRYINLFGYNKKYGVSGSRISSVRYEPQGFENFVKLYERSAPASALL